MEYDDKILKATFAEGHRSSGDDADLGHSCTLEKELMLNLGPLSRGPEQPL